MLRLYSRGTFVAANASCFDVIKLNSLEQKLKSVNNVLTEQLRTPVVKTTAAIAYLC